MKKDSNSNPQGTWNPALISPPGASAPMKEWRAFFGKNGEGGAGPPGRGGTLSEVRQVREELHGDKGRPPGTGDRPEQSDRPALQVRQKLTTGLSSEKNNRQCKQIRGHGS